MAKFDIKKDGNTDFEKLLASAKDRHREMKEAVAACGSPALSAEADRHRRRWYDWCKTNLTDRGIDMTVKADTGEPAGLFVVVAGSSI